MPFWREFCILETVSHRGALSVFSFFILSFGIYGQTLDLSTEFPNYIGEQVQSKSQLEARSRQLENAISSVIFRIQVPIRNPKTANIEPIPFFAYAIEKLRAVDSDVEVLTSGGVLRSVIGYIYKRITDAKAINPSISVDEILKDITSETTLIPTLDVRGVGSDLDVWFRTPHLEKSDQLRRTARSLSPRHDSSQLSKGLFAESDSENYDVQIRRSMRQGGSTLDFLSFNLTTRKFMEPPKRIRPGWSSHTIVEDLILGKYFYLENYQAESYLTAKQAVRGARPLFELPFLSLPNAAILMRDLDNAIARAKKDGTDHSRDSLKATDQLHRLFRNVRDGGAHNRAYRATERTVEYKLLELAKALTRNESAPLLPEFIDDRPIIADKPDVPADSLISYEDFIKNYTRGGEIYHGTPALEGAFSIFRKGLLVSRPKDNQHGSQGRAYFGGGAYASRSKSVAQDYAGSRGIVLPLRIARNPNLRILNWSRAKDMIQFRELSADAERKNRDPFEYISTKLKIEIIVNKHILIQNSRSVEYPTDLSAICDSLIPAIKDENGDWTDNYLALFEHFELSRFAKELGHKIKPVDHYAWLRKWKSIDSDHYYDAMRELDVPEEIEGYAIGQAIREGEIFHLYHLASNGMLSNEKEARVNAVLTRLLLPQILQNPANASEDEYRYVLDLQSEDQILAILNKFLRTADAITIDRFLQECIRGWAGFMQYPSVMDRLLKFFDDREVERFSQAEVTQLRRTIRVLAYETEHEGYLNSYIKKQSNDPNARYDFASKLLDFDKKEFDAMIGDLEAMAAPEKESSETNPREEYIKKNRKFIKAIIESRRSELIERSSPYFSRTVFSSPADIIEFYEASPAKDKGFDRLAHLVAPRDSDSSFEDPFYYFWNIYDTRLQPPLLEHIKLHSEYFWKLDPSFDQSRKLLELASRDSKLQKKLLRRALIRFKSPGQRLTLLTDTCETADDIEGAWEKYGREILASDVTRDEILRAFQLSEGQLGPPATIRRLGNSSRDILAFLGAWINQHPWMLQHQVDSIRGFLKAYLSQNPKVSASEAATISYFFSKDQASQAPEYNGPKINQRKVSPRRYQMEFSKACAQTVAAMGAVRKKLRR